jgi:NitT/TauT family transport system substrate-binding protein
VLIVPTRLAEKPPMGLRELTTGWFQALGYLSKKPDDAAKRVAGREGLTPKQFRHALELLKFSSHKENAYQLSAPYAAFSERMRGMADFMWKNGMLKSELNPSNLRTDILLRGEP